MADTRIKDITTVATASDIAAGNYFVLDTPNGTKKLGADEVNSADYYDLSFEKTITKDTRILTINDVSLSKSAGEKIVIYAEATNDCVRNFAICNQSYKEFNTIIPVGVPFELTLGTNTTSIGILVLQQQAVANGALKIYIRKKPDANKIDLQIEESKRKQRDFNVKISSLEEKSYGIADCVSYGYFNDNGEVVSNSNWMVTDFIYVGASDFVIPNLRTESGIGAFFYDENKNKLSILNRFLYGRKINVPSEAAYIRCSFRIESGANNSLVVGAANSKERKNKSIYEKIAEAKNVLAIDYLDFEIVGINKEIRTFPIDESSLYGSAGIDVVKTKIKCGKGRIYVDDCGHGLGGQAIILADENGNKIRSTQSWNTDGEKSLSLEGLDGDYYLYVNVVSSELVDGSYIYNGKTIYYSPYAEEPKTFILSDRLKKPFDFANKKVLLLGDSGMKGVVDSPSGNFNTWANDLFYSLGCSSVDNKSVPGSSFYASGSQVSIQSEIEGLTNPHNYDFVFIMAGANDFIHSLDSYEPLLLQALKDFCQCCKDNFRTDTHVVFILPPIAKNLVRYSMSTGRRLWISDFSRTIAEIAGSYGYQYINGTSFGLPDEKSSSYAISELLAVDEIHPSAKGYSLLSDSVRNALL